MFEEEGIWVSCMMPDYFPPEVSAVEQHPLSLSADLDDFLSINFPTSSPNLGSLLVQQPAISEYDLGGGGDLFDAPTPLLQDSLLASDPLTSAISMMAEYGIAEMESIQNEDLLNEVFFHCNDDLLADPTEPFVAVPEASEFVAPLLQTEEDGGGEKMNRPFAEETLQKSVSLECLSSVGSTSVSNVGNCLLDVHEIDLEAAFGMMTRTYSEGDIHLFDVPEMNLEAAFRMRTCSEGDIQAIGINNFAYGDINVVNSFELLSTLEDVKIEERSQKLSRYRKKRTQRNFGRKIKYACRKALADSQPRIRGRFAKMKDKHAETSTEVNCKLKE
ncbi:hypothetical protein Cni_G22954 [Canna indica]|uniref:CCT domain-containing protein n=1 Tax=Canna indica TaxID=4628 RepID=A0AAQ3QK17_9LILI|nr:hypothetical protein Cni_G22954 [Canna indica]